MITTGFQKIRGWGIFEYEPSEGGEVKRCIIVRDTHEDALRVLKTLQETNINFEVMQIEGLTYDM